jgi:hypothetical protein
MESGFMSDDKRTNPTHAYDHMTVAHVQQTIETRPQPEIMKKHLTTAHLAEALPASAAQQPASAPISASVPASPPPSKDQK